MNVFLGKNLDVLKVMDKIIGVDLAIAEARINSPIMAVTCRKLGIQFRELSSEDDLRDLIPESPTLVAIASFATILSQSVIDRCGLILNFHGGLIQSCRGRHPLPSAIINQHEFIGITCHIIDSEKIDAGPTVAQISLPLDYDTDFDSNDKRLLKAFPQLAQMVFEDYDSTRGVVARPLALDPEGYFPPVDQSTMDRLFAASSLNNFFESGP